MIDYLLDEETGLYKCTRPSYTAFYKDTRGRELHNHTGAPAVINTTGQRYWYVDGLLHREDGPAIDHGPNSLKPCEYYLKGCFYPTEEAFQKELQANYHLPGAP